jgi:hypothetical protein
VAGKQTGERHARELRTLVGVEDFRPAMMRIPIYSGRVFRREAGHRSDLKPSTIPK